MDVNLYDTSTSTAPEIAVRELLFVGFSGDFDANIFNFPYESPNYNYEIVNQPVKAFRWLESRVESITTFQPPFAILVKFGWMKANDFQFLQNVASHPDLKFIPIIALCEEGDEFSAKILAVNGLDDCYTVPIEWGLLESRLEFLNQHKPRLIQKPWKEDATYSPRMPLSKRLFDIAGALFAIALLSPIWVPVMLAILVETGFPIVYRSKRAGMGYHVFDFLKFRSMYKDADQRLEEMKQRNQYGGDAIFQKIANDPRVTPVGRFIRKFSIDELPQLVNILKGDMSLVGNRPLPLYEAQELTRDAIAARFLAPAGLTGLWQVTKRGSSDMSAEERIALDVEYAKKRSFWFDLKILFRTFTAFIQKEDV